MTAATSSSGSTVHPADQMITQMRHMLRQQIRHAAEHHLLTPESVMMYAALMLSTDDHLPITPAAHHLLWLRFLCDERIKKLLIIAPPESAKTTWVLSAFVGTYIALWPERNVIIGSASGPIAEKRSLSLRSQIDSQPFRATFPEIRRARGMMWSTNEWSVAPNGKPLPGRLHPTVAAYGTGGSVIGSRADLVLADDLLDFENSRTNLRRQLIENWFHKSLLSRRKSRTGRAVVIGTAWHHDDLYQHLQQEGGWVVVKVPLLGDGPDFYATIMYPDDWEYEKIGEYAGRTDKTGHKL